ncbi:hypothetical protein NMD15_08415 [Plesiomonas shigelloides]|uniref:hypothetical protein n=1 Tax=Plesiomonas shigelloides TaxID=703 RepID=UPI00351D33EF
MVGDLSLSTDFFVFDPQFASALGHTGDLFVYYRINGTVRFISAAALVYAVIQIMVVAYGAEQTTVT